MNNATKSILATLALLTAGPLAAIEPNDSNQDMVEAGFWSSIKDGFVSATSTAAGWVSDAYHFVADPVTNGLNDLGCAVMPDQSPSKCGTEHSAEFLAIQEACTGQVQLDDLDTCAYNGFLTTAEAWQLCSAQGYYWDGAQCLIPGPQNYCDGEWLGPAVALQWTGGIQCVDTDTKQQVDSAIDCQQRFNGERVFVPELGGSKNMCLEVMDYQELICLKELDGYWDESVSYDGNHCFEDRNQRDAAKCIQNGGEVYTYDSGKVDCAITDQDVERISCKAGGNYWADTAVGGVNCFANYQDWKIAKCDLDPSKYWDGSRCKNTPTGGTPQDLNPSDSSGEVETDVGTTAPGSDYGVTCYGGRAYYPDYASCMTPTEAKQYACGYDGNVWHQDTNKCIDNAAYPIYICQQDGGEYYELYGCAYTPEDVRYFECQDAGGWFYQSSSSNDARPECYDEASYEYLTCLDNDGTWIDTFGCMFTSDVKELCQDAGLLWSRSDKVCIALDGTDIPVGLEGFFVFMQDVEYQAFQADYAGALYWLGDNLQALFDEGVIGREELADIIDRNYQNWYDYAVARQAEIEDDLEAITGDIAVDYVEYALVAQDAYADFTDDSVKLLERLAFIGSRIDSLQYYDSEPPTTSIGALRSAVTGGRDDQLQITLPEGITTPTETENGTFEFNLPVCIKFPRLEAPGLTKVEYELNEIFYSFNWGAGEVKGSVLGDEWGVPPYTNNQRVCNDFQFTYTESALKSAIIVLGTTSQDMQTQFGAEYEETYYWDDGSTSTNTMYREGGEANRGYRSGDSTTSDWYNTYQEAMSGWEQGAKGIDSQYSLGLALILQYWWILGIMGSLAVIYFTGGLDFIGPIQRHRAKRKAAKNPAAPDPLALGVDDNLGGGL